MCPPAGSLVHACVHTSMAAHEPLPSTVSPGKWHAGVTPFQVTAETAMLILLINLIASTALSHMMINWTPSQLLGLTPALEYQQQQGHSQGVCMLPSGHLQDAMHSGCG